MKETLHVLFKEFGCNHEIAVYDTTELYGEKGSFRVLQFSNEAIQGAMDLHAPERIVFEYPRAMIHLMEANAKSFEKIFVIGHGIGTIPGYFADKRCKVAELNEKVIELSRKYFGYRQDNVIACDGRRILENEPPHSYDYILVDAFTDQGTPRHLTSKSFFAMTREKLDSRGFIIMNLMGRGGYDKLINAVFTTLGEEYPYCKSFSLPSETAAGIQNIILIGGSKPIAFQARSMAGFKEIALGAGHIITDG